jgi:hypothetical protein
MSINVVGSGNSRQIIAIDSFVDGEREFVFGRIKLNPHRPDPAIIFPHEKTTFL